MNHYTITHTITLCQLTAIIYLYLRRLLMLLSHLPPQARLQWWAENPPTAKISQPQRIFPPNSTHKQILLVCFALHYENQT